MALQRLHNYPAGLMRKAGKNNLVCPAGGTLSVFLSVLLWINILKPNKDMIHNLKTMHEKRVSGLSILSL